MSFAAPQLWFPGFWLAARYYFDATKNATWMLLGCYLDATWMLPGVTGLELKGALASGQDEGLNCDKFPSFTLPPPPPLSLPFEFEIELTAPSSSARWRTHLKLTRGRRAAGRNAGQVETVIRGINRGQSNNNISNTHTHTQRMERCSSH